MSMDTLAHQEESAMGTKAAGFTPVKAGDVVVLMDTMSSYHLTDGYSQRPVFSLVKVTQVDGEGTVKRIKTRPRYRTEELGRRDVMVVKQDKDYRRLLVALWTANDYSWSSTEEASAAIKAGIEAVKANGGKPVKHGRQALDPIVA